jgi:hypothetical protein
MLAVTFIADKPQSQAVHGTTKRDAMQ